MCGRGLEGGGRGKNWPAHILYAAAPLPTRSILAEMHTFLKQSLARSDSVWVVTISQLLDWMEKPVAVGQVRA